MSEVRADGLEGQLRRLVPNGPSREGIVFAAGRRAGQRGLLFWRAATLGLTLVSLGLGGWLLRQPDPVVVERIVYVSVPAPTPADRVPSAAREGGAEAVRYRRPPVWVPALGPLRDRQLALRLGIDALPLPALPPPPPEARPFAEDRDGPTGPSFWSERF